MDDTTQLYQSVFGPASTTRSPALDQTRQPRPSSYADIVERRNQQSTAYRGKARPLVYKYREKLSEQKSCTPGDRKLYTDLVLFLLFFRYQEHFDQVIDAVMSGENLEMQLRFSLFREFQADARHQLAPFGENSPEIAELPHIFACYFQIHRAFHYVTRSFAGYSPSMVKLRSDVWESIFTHDMERYKRSLYRRMQEIPTSITGPSGTGKELVARAIGLSRYIPFDEERTRFARPFDDGFYPINLTALSETLLESELFGHRKGSFTGALQDRVGFIERAGALGSVFLDEIGDVSLTTQVKLLRLLQSRIYQRLGDTTEYTYEGNLLRQPTVSSMKGWKTASFGKISIIDSRLTESARRHWQSRFVNAQKCFTRWFISLASVSRVKPRLSWSQTKPWRI